ncbi:MAG: Ribonuclease HI, partial [uncultured Nocardioides sp.]
DHRGGRRLGTRQPRTSGMGVVRRRVVLGFRRVAARHEQHGRADGRARPPPADGPPRRRAARLLRQHLCHQRRHQVDGRLEAQGLEDRRRPAGQERRADEGAGRGDGGSSGPGEVRVGQGPRRA